MKQFTAHSTPGDERRGSLLFRTSLGSSVRERFIEAWRIVFQFTGLEDLAAIQTLNVLGVVVFGDQSRALVLAGRVGHCKTPVRSFLYYKSDVRQRTSNSSCGYDTGSKRAWKKRKYFGSYTILSPRAFSRCS